ncbi:MAG: SoxR reducing system RseC family protein [Gammaproteobacteria bacterium]
MLEQAAEVTRAAPEGAWVQAVEPSGCGTCGGQGCSTRRLAEMFQRTPRHFLVDSDFALAPGDRVVVGIADGSVLGSALRAYGLPLGMMLAGALSAQAIQPGDGPAVAGLLIGGAVGWMLARGGRMPRPRVLRREIVPVMQKGKP